MRSPLPSTRLEGQAAQTPRLRGALATLLLPALLFAWVAVVWRQPPVATDRLPTYDLAFACDHCAGSIEPLLSDDSRLRITLRPARALTTPVTVQSFVQTGRALSPWPVPFVAAPTGVLQLRATLSALPALPPGRSTLLFRVSTTAMRNGQAGALRVQDLSLPVHVTTAHAG